MTARDQLVTLLDDILPATINVIGYARTIDPPSKPTVLVRLDKVIPSSTGMFFRGYQFGVVLVPTKTEPGPADDELDALLEDVLDAIDASDQIVWAQAERGTFQDTTYPAYEVTLTATHPKE